MTRRAGVVNTWGQVGEVSAAPATTTPTRPPLVRPPNCGCVGAALKAPSRNCPPLGGSKPVGALVIPPGGCPPATPGGPDQGRGYSCKGRYPHDGHDGKRPKPKHSRPNASHAGYAPNPLTMTCHLTTSWHSAWTTSSHGPPIPNYGRTPATSPRLMHDATSNAEPKPHRWALGCSPGNGKRPLRHSRALMPAPGG